MKVLALPRYDHLGASSRLRIAQYFPYLKAANIEVICHALLNDDYVKNLYAGRYDIMAAVYGYCIRINILLKARQFDVLWVEKESLPWLPALCEIGLYRDVRLCVDYDDAVFHRYDMHSSVLVRNILGRKLDKVMKRADLVTVGNSYLSERAQMAGSTWIEQVPTVIDLHRYLDLKRFTSSIDATVIGWIGSPSTAGYLRLVSDILTGLSRKYRIRCVAIGATADQVMGTPFELLPWSESTEVDMLKGMDIGIMPLSDTPWEQGKCGYKLIQYMACGLPVVASPVGVNLEIVKHGSSGFLAADGVAWRESLERLIVDGSMRARMGAVGRKVVEQEYCSQIQGPRLVDMLYKLVNR